MGTTKPLKIGFLLDTSLDPDDGVQQYILALGDWLTSKGHDVTFLVGETKKRTAPNIYSLTRNISVSFNGNKTTIPLPASSKKINEFLKSHKFDVVHVQSPHSPFLSQKVIKRLPPNTVIIGTFHILPYGWLAGIGNRLLGMALKSSIKRIDKMLAVSASAKDFCKMTFKVDAEVLPNVLNYKRFSQASPIERYSDGKTNILFLGRLVKRKGCQQLFKAVAALDSDMKSNLRLIICGKGQLQSELEKTVKKLGLSDITTFEGYISEQDKPNYYASADISVFPSFSGESFGIVLLEAMASGKSAVLAGNNPGYATVMNPRHDLLFDPNNIDELSAKIKLLINNSKARQEAADWGTQYTKTFDVDVIGSRLVSIYLSEIAKKQSLKHN